MSELTSTEIGASDRMTRCQRDLRVPEQRLDRQQRADDHDGSAEQPSMRLPRTAAVSTMPGSLPHGSAPAYRRPDPGHDAAAIMGGDSQMSISAQAPARGSEVDWFGLLAKFAPLIFLLVLMAVFAMRRAALPDAAQPVQRDAAGLDQRPARDRHDLRHPDRRHRPVGRLAAGLRRARRGRGRQGRACRTASRSARARRIGYGWPLALLAAIAVGTRRRLAPGPGHHPAQGAALRGDAGRHVGVSRRGAAVRRRRPDQRLRARLSSGGARARSARCRCR